MLYNLHRRFSRKEPSLKGIILSSIAFYLLSVLRARGHFGNVTVFWHLYANDSITPLLERQEFTNTSGSITFTTGEDFKVIVLEAVSDTLPEFDEYFVLKLVNISGESKRKVDHGILHNVKYVTYCKKSTRKMFVYIF